MQGKKPPHPRKGIPMQIQTTTVHFDPNYTFDWDDPTLNYLKDWPSFRIELAGRVLVFDLAKGIAFEQHEGMYRPLVVQGHEYQPAVIKSEDECYFKDGIDENGFDEDEFDATLLWERGQQGWLTFTRLHWVNGKPQPAKAGEVMSSVSISLKGTTFTLTEYTWINGTPWFLDGSEPLEALSTTHSDPYPKSVNNYFTEEIEVVQIPSDLQVTEERLICTWKHSKVGKIEVFQYETFNGEKMTRAVLTDKKGHQFHLHNTTDNPAELTCGKGQLNWQKGEWIVARGMRKTAPNWKTGTSGQIVVKKYWSRRRQWTLQMNRMAA